MIMKEKQIQSVTIKLSKERLNAERQITTYLESQHYQVNPRVTKRGKSGISHTFDILANRDDMLTIRTIAICIIYSSDNSSVTTTVFDFANKCFDTGIREKVIIAIPDLSPDSKQVAQEQGIKVLDEAKLEAMVARSQSIAPRAEKPLKLSNKASVIESIKDIGYRIAEQASIKGKSGAEHIFDIVLYDNGAESHSVVIDFFEDEEELDLDKVSIFDGKAYDVGAYGKVIAVSTKLTQNAKQFAENQRIKVITYGKNAIEEQTKSAQENKKKGKSTKELASATKTIEDDLRQLPQNEALKLIPEVLARRYNLVPIKISGSTLEVAMADPTDILALEALSAQSKKRIKAIAATAKDVREAIDFNYKGYGEIEKHLSSMSINDEITDDRLAIDAAVDAPLARALDLIIDEASKSRASDIHIEPEEDRLRIRYRIDGTLHDTMSLPINVHRAIISRVKILADMNIADHHHAQDGQFTHKTSSREVDIRVATSPTVNGEMTVLRLLDISRAVLGLSELGFLPESQEKFENLLKVPYGMLLISGPTGAGKTTTLYASINSLDTLGRNIVTIEDPAEYRFTDINQIQVNNQAGITFASGLRSILRLDPDVILVGEIRDSETANIAVQAAMTGHLMLSSIHANDSSGALFRLLDLNIEPFLIASAVIGTVAQRMVRRICPYCTHKIEAPAVEQIAYEREIGEKKTKFLYGTGCKTCSFTGYLGRVAIFEILVLSDSIRKMIIGETGANEVRTQAIKEGMQTMMNDGMHKVKDGITTPAEVLRSAYSPEVQI